MNFSSLIGCVGACVVATTDLSLPLLSERAAVVVVDDDGDVLEPVEPLIEGPGLLTREEELRRAVVVKVGVEYDEAQKAAEAGIQKLLEEARRSSSSREGMQFNRELYGAVVPFPVLQPHELQIYAASKFTEQPPRQPPSATLRRQRWRWCRGRQRSSSRRLAPHTPG